MEKAKALSGEDAAVAGGSRVRVGKKAGEERMHYSKSITHIILRALDVIDGKKESHDLWGSVTLVPSWKTLRWLVETW